MAYFTGTATDVHDMLQIMSTNLAANGWTVDRDAVAGSGRELLVHNGETYVQMRSNTVETLSACGIGYFASNTVETGIFITGSVSFDNAKAWDAQPGRVGRYSDGLGMPCWLDTDGNTGSFTYHLYIWNTGTPEVWLIVEYSAGFYNWLSFGELEQIHDWGFARGVPFHQASRFIYRNTSLINDANYGAGGPFGNYRANGESAWFCRYIPASLPADTYEGPSDPDNAGQTSPWSGTAMLTNVNSFYGGTARFHYGMATQLGVDLVMANPSTFNGADILIPFYVGRARVPATVDGQNANNPWQYNWSFLGVSNHSRFVDMTNNLPGDTLIIDGVTWQVWPNHFIGQATVPYWGSSNPPPANLGFAVKQNVP